MLNSRDLALIRLPCIFFLALFVSYKSREEANAQAKADTRPNILWLTCEDTGIELGCYGDDYASTPCIDSLAARGMRYLTAWSNAPVCAPARSTLISGMYPPSLGSHHMRSLVRMPDDMRMYPCYLREAGYYCTNNSKQKPSEELYDLKDDPDEVGNLFESSEHKAVLQRMRRALREWQIEIRDVGLLPEGELHRRSAGSTPYQLGHDETRYDLEAVLAAADLATNGKTGKVALLKKSLVSSDSAVRYWAAIGLLCRGKPAADAAQEELHEALDDDSPSVRIAAAESLARYGSLSERQPALDTLCRIAQQETNGYAALEAVNALEYVTVDLITQGADPQALADRLKAIGPDREYFPESPLNNKLAGGRMLPPL